MDVGNQGTLQRKKEMEEAKAKEAEGKEEGTPTELPLPMTSSSSPSSPSHEFSFTISFHSPYTTAAAAAAAAATKSPSSVSRSSLFDLAPADDIFFHGHLLPLQLLSCAPPVSPRGGAGPPVQDRDGEQSRGSAATDAIRSNNSNSSSSSSSNCSSSSNGDAKERMKNSLMSSLFGGMGRWRKTNEAGEREGEDEKMRKRSAFDAMSKLLKRYVSAVEPLLSFGAGRGGGRRGALWRRPYSFAGNPSAGAATAGGGREEWRRRRGELSAPASMRTSPSNSGLLVAAPVGGSSDESTMEELQSAIEAAIAHCKNSMITMKEERWKC